MLSAEDLRAFEESGYVCIDVLSTPGGLTPGELDRAEETWDRLVSAEVEGLSNSGPQRPDSLRKQQQLAADQGFIELICNPFFEELAKQVLRSEEVRVIELGPHHRAGSQRRMPPTAEEARELWATGAHIDFQITTADFNATPRRDLLAVWFWVDDVPAERAAMRILPGSHRPIMQHWDSVLSNEHRQLLPRCHGMRMLQTPKSPSFPEHFPEPKNWHYSRSEPVPVEVKRGTVQIFTQSYDKSLSQCMLMPVTSDTAVWQNAAFRMAEFRQPASQRFYNRVVCRICTHRICPKSLRWIAALLSVAATVCG